MRYWLEIAAVHLVRGAIRVMPRALVRPCGRLLGYAFHLFDRVHRRVADTNLAMAFPQRTPDERRTITREMFGHFGCLLLELLKFSTLSHEAMGRLVEFEGDVCIVPPNSFALARSVEYFRIPRNVLTVTVGKSTYARCGIITTSPGSSD